MITSASLTGVARCPGLPDAEIATRGDANHPMSPTDLLEFGCSPQRWRFYRPNDDEKSWDWQDLLRAYVMVPAVGHAQYLPRPRTYPAMQNTCPVCKSVSSADICRKCSQRRREVTVEREWAGGAEYCKGWKQDAEKRGSFVISADDHQRTLDAVQRLANDPAIAALYGGGRVWQNVTATWQDADTGLKIPLAATAHMIPEEGSVLDQGVGALYVAPNAAPGPWTAQAARSGLHVASALVLDLVRAAINEDRTRYFWCLIEPRSPHVVARREPTAELLQAGRDCYGQLLQAYARCLKNDTWPAFDPQDDNLAASWSGVGKELWMSELEAHSSAYFGVDAAMALPTR